MSNDIKKSIDERLSSLTFDEVLIKKIKNKTIESEYHKPILKRGLVVAAAVMCSFLFSVTALASTVPAFNNLIAMISPEAAQYLKPINKSVEDNGIKMEVLSALTDGKTSVVYISLQDLTDNRIDETIDIYDYDIRGAAALTGRLISYNKESNTAIFCIIGSEGENLSGRKISVSVSTLLSSKTTYNDFETRLSLRDIVHHNPSVIPLSNFLFAGGGYEEKTQLNIDENKMNVLQPDTMSVPLGDYIDFVTISNAGFADGMLHIQTKWGQSVDNHGDIYLKDHQNQKLVASTIYFQTSDDKNNGILTEKHIEYVYDISPEEDLSRYSLWAWLCKEGECVTGNWEVTFSLDKVDTDDLYIEGMRINSIQ